MASKKNRAKGTFRGLKSQNHRSTEGWFCDYLTSCLENKLDVRIVCRCEPKRKGPMMAYNDINVMSMGRSLEAREVLKK